MKPDMAKALELYDEVDDYLENFVLERGLRSNDTL